jgi:hypothetical protein
VLGSNQRPAAQKPVRDGRREQGLTGVCEQPRRLGPRGRFVPLLRPSITFGGQPAPRPAPARARRLVGAIVQQTVVTWDPLGGRGRVRTRAVRPMGLPPRTPGEEYFRSLRLEGYWASAHGQKSQSIGHGHGGEGSGPVIVAVRNQSGGGQTRTCVPKRRHCRRPLGGGLLHGGRLRPPFLACPFALGASYSVAVKH